MDRSTMIELLNHLPFQIEMNDGKKYIVEDHGDIAIGDIAVVVVAKCEDGKYRHKWLALVCMCSVEPVLKKSA